MLWFKLLWVVDAFLAARFVVGSLALINPAIRLCIMVSIAFNIISGGCRGDQPGCSEHSCVVSSWLQWFVPGLVLGLSMSIIIMPIHFLASFDVLCVCWWNSFLLLSICASLPLHCNVTYASEIRMFTSRSLQWRFMQILSKQRFMSTSSIQLQSCLTTCAAAAGICAECISAFGRGFFLWLEC